MISTRILDNDMGSVAKVPLTGRGTVHGITVELDKVKLPEIDMGILEMLSSDMGVKRFSEHAEEHLSNQELEKKFIDAYKSFTTPIFKSGQSRY
jgi:hypothetical protein